MSKLADLQDIVVKRLTAVDDSVPAPVPQNGKPLQWLSKRIGDVSNIVNLQTGVLKIGILGIVLTPGGVLYRKDEGRQISIYSKIEVQIQENVVLNHGPGGSGIDALDLVEFVMKRLNYFSISGQRSAIQRVELDEEPYALIQEIPTLVYNINFRIPLTIS